MTIFSHVYTWNTLVAMKTSDDNDTDAPSERIVNGYPPKIHGAKRHGDPERLIRQQFRF
jgi:hypothetical protein